MKKVFIPKKISAVDNPNVFQWDYLDSIQEQMECDEYGFYHSFCKKPISLMQKKRKKTVLVQGWDLGNGNVLSCSYKMIECVKSYNSNKDVYYVACTCPNLSLENQKWDCTIVWLYVIPLRGKIGDVFWDKSKNIFDLIEPQTVFSEGMNGALAIDNSNTMTILRWKSKHAYSDSMLTFSYVIETGKLERTIVANQKYENIIEKKRTKGGDNTVEFYQLTDSELYVAVLQPVVRRGSRCPVVVIPLGGPNIEIPDFSDSSIYYKMAKCGFMVVVPLRRGVIGISREWEHALEGNYGHLDVVDIIDGTKYILKKFSSLIDDSRVVLYGASYGGYTALLIACKHNADKMFKAVVSHCGMSDLGRYPFECTGNVCDVMNCYAETNDEKEYLRIIQPISPYANVCYLKIPVLLVHTLDDNCVWFGQSVRFYNRCIQYGIPARLLLAKGGHSYHIENEDALFCMIMGFLENVTF